MIKYKINLPRVTWNERQHYDSIVRACKVYSMKKEIPIMTNREIAEKLGVVPKHVENIYTKISNAIRAGDVSVIRTDMGAAPRLINKKNKLHRKTKRLLRELYTK